MTQKVSVAGMVTVAPAPCARAIAPSTSSGVLRLICMAMLACPSAARGATSLM